MLAETHKSCYSKSMKPKPIRDLFEPVKCVVYMAVNKVNGKRYIGATGRGIDRRSHGHFYNAKRGKSNVVFARAIRKYGTEAFEFKLLRICSDFFDALKHEARLIAELKPEYNLTAGGGGIKGFKFPEEAKEKMRAAKLGRPNHWSNGQMPQHIRDRLADARRAERGRKLTDKQRESMRRNASTANGARRRRVFCLNDGVVYESVTAAAKACGVTTSTIVNTCLGRFKSRSGIMVQYHDQ